MKKKHVWLLGELGFMAAGAVNSWLMYTVCYWVLPRWVSVLAGIVVYSLTAVFGIEWFHRGITPEERFLQGNDPY